MYDLVVRRGPIIVHGAGCPDERFVAEYAIDALAAWGLRAPDALTDGTWVEQLAETGEYTADVAWAHVAIRRAP